MGGILMTKMRCQAAESKSWTLIWTPPLHAAQTLQRTFAIQCASFLQQATPAGFEIVPSANGPLDAAG
ncbi:hypothetical protein Dda_7629 [Drechslerella dactyloides]|uniref:Uncharacterized protein n=1 Tax=Drechslerella dactyloides TaxID=74499 RepID=A0AAD6ISI7_DREDA|nr:hypothetical protein Dda_7629 [Drechslerella dactyloides]